jgi:hypothetical protein
MSRPPSERLPQFPIQRRPEPPSDEDGGLEKVVWAAYPQGLMFDDYIGLCAVLSQHTGLSGTSHVISDLFSVKQSLVYNDASGFKCDYTYESDEFINYKGEKYDIEYKTTIKNIEDCVNQLNLHGYREYWLHKLPRTKDSYIYQVGGHAFDPLIAQIRNSLSLHYPDGIEIRSKEAVVIYNSVLYFHGQQTAYEFMWHLFDANPKIFAYYATTGEFASDLIIEC